MNLSEDEARARLAGARVARLATVGADGQPHLVPVCFAAEDDVIVIAVDHKPKATTDLRRLRNIRANRAVCVLADHYADDWGQLWWARADGLAAILAVRTDNAIDLLARKYPQYRERRPDGLVIAIGVSRWSGWAAGPGA